MKEMGIEWGKERWGKEEADKGARQGGEGGGEETEKEKRKEKKNHTRWRSEGLYANLQSPNSKSLKLGCNAEDEPM